MATFNPVAYLFMIFSKRWSYSSAWGYSPCIWWSCPICPRLEATPAWSPISSVIFSERWSVLQRLGVLPLEVMQVTDLVEARCHAIPVADLFCDLQ